MKSFAAPTTFTVSATALSGKRRFGPRGGETGLAADGAFRFLAQRPITTVAVSPVHPTHLAPLAAPLKPVSPNGRAVKERDA